MNTINTKPLQYNNVKTTEGQQKKHIKQMNIQETQYLNNRINSLDLSKTTFSFHFFDNKRNINEYTVLDMLRNKQYQLIQYNSTPDRYRNTNDKRVLLRTNIKSTINKTEGNYTTTQVVSLCIVVSLTNNCIVTGYYNAVDDKHYTLNWSRYCKDLQIIDVRVQGNVGNVSQQRHSIQQTQ